MTRSRPLVALLVVATGGPLLGPLLGALPATGASERPAVVERRVIGTSVEGRPIHAWRVGNPASPRKAVAIATMHGDEAAPRRILWRLRDGAPVKGVDLWLVPILNPDGYAAGRRQNARGVDLNRNFPTAWAPLDGEVESGPGPASEPETVAIMRFLRQIDPRFVVSFHQPLNGVDTYDGKKPWFARRLAAALRLPSRSFACDGTCHGTMSQWVNRRFDGVAVTVEYSASPTRWQLLHRGPRGLLEAVGGWR